jgi:hypothetical protein
MARFRLTSPKIKITENHVEKACIQLAEYKGYYPLRLHVGRYIHADKQVLRALTEAGVPFRMATMGVPGLPDWVLIHGEHSAFLLETKAPDGRLSKDQEQMHWILRQCHRVKVCVANSVARFEAFLADHERSP